MSKWLPIATAPRDRAIIGWNEYFPINVYRMRWFGVEAFRDGIWMTCSDPVWRVIPTHWMDFPEFTDIMRGIERE